MVREVLTINVGQAGIQLGQSVWKQYNAEHEISNNGKREINNKNNKNNKNKNENKKFDDHSFEVFYSETSAGQFVPRNLSVDLEPNVIDDVKNSDISGIFNPNFLLSGKEDASNNFARGHYTVGKEMIDKISDCIRRLSDKCENLQGFVINHSVGGGTGSGLGALILERLAVDYRRKAKLGFEIYPSTHLNTSVVAPYNALLSTHWLIDHTDVSLILDNEALYNIMQRQVDIQRPSYENINKLISKAISSLTASLRFKGDLNVDLQEFQTNLVPFPRLHFMISGMAPILDKGKVETYKPTVRDITDSCFQSNQWLVDIEDYEMLDDKFMAISLNYRGNIQGKEANSSVQWLKKNDKLKIVEWCPTGFKIGLNDIPAAVLPDDDIASFNKNVTMIGNNVGIRKVFSGRVCKKYDLMYSQRAFVHWFVGEGMEEGEFDEAREDLGYLEKDYLDVLSEDTDDEEKENDDDDDDDLLSDEDF